MTKKARRQKSQPVTNLREPIWAQQPYEPPAAFGEFQLYRDMGSTRTQAAISAETGRDRTNIGDRAKRWRWEERSTAWDIHLDQIKTKAVEDASKSMATRQAKLGMMLQDKAVVALESLDVSEATAKDVVQMAEAGVKIERLARGENTGEDHSVTIMLPSVPSWAKGSKFLTPAPTEIPTIPVEIIDDSKA